MFAYKWFKLIDSLKNNMLMFWLQRENSKFPCVVAFIICMPTAIYKWKESVIFYRATQKSIKMR